MDNKLIVQIDPSTQPQSAIETINERLFSLKRSRSAFIGHLTRLSNTIGEKLSFNENVKSIKCLEEQLYQVLDKLKNTNDEYISLASDPSDIENASGVYYEQYSRVVGVSENIETFILKQQTAENSFLQTSKLSTTKSKTNSHVSSTSSSTSYRTSRSSHTSVHSTQYKKAKAELKAIQACEKFIGQDNMVRSRKN